MRHSSRNLWVGAAFFSTTLVAMGVSGGSVAHAQTVNNILVAGSANPFLAGMPDGSGASGDTAPDQSPTLVTGLTFTPGSYLTFSVTGSVDYGGGTPSDPPDGQDSGAGFYATGHGEENGIGGYTAPANALVGVFLDGTQPDSTAAPDSLDFTSSDPAAIGLTFSSLSPQLKQVFFIGDGLTGNGSGTAQKFFIPTGAVRLFLGTVDGSGWFNNTGSFTVSATQPQIGGSATAPEPGALALIGAAALPFVGIVRRRRL